MTAIVIPFVRAPNVADARAEGFKIIPRCSYVMAQARRHPAWSDVLADR